MELIILIIKICFSLQMNTFKFIYDESCYL